MLKRITMVLSASSHMHLLAQGDREDRRNIKNADIQREKEQKVQRDLDERLLEARKLAGMGYTVEEIEKELKRIKMVRSLAAACIANNVSGIACIRLKLVQMHQDGASDARCIHF